MTEVSIEEYERRAQEWTDALPAFEQTTGGLHRAGDGYCCLGVGSEVSKLGFWAEFDETDAEGEPLCSWVAEEYREEVGLMPPVEDINEDFVLTTPQEASLMPREVVDYYGMTDNVGSFDWFTLPVHLRWLILQHLTSTDVIGQVKDEQKAQLLDPDAPMGLYGSPKNLAFLNDRGVSFWLIAEVIKAQPKGLFTWVH